MAREYVRWLEKHTPRGTYSPRTGEVLLRASDYVWLCPYCRHSRRAGSWEPCGLNRVCSNCMRLLRFSEDVFRDPERDPFETGEATLKVRWSKNARALELLAVVYTGNMAWSLATTVVPDDVGDGCDRSYEWLRRRVVNHLQDIDAPVHVLWAESRGYKI